MKFIFVAGAALVLLAAPAFADNWSQWRGEHRDGKSAESGLLKEWPAGGPKLLWKATGLGKGFGSVSVQGDNLYAFGDLSDGNYVMCLANDGKVLWSTKVGRAGKAGPSGWEFAGPRSTPTVEGGRVFVLDQYGELVCVNASDGKEQWRKNFQKDFGAENPPDWGYSESPLVDSNRLLVTPGGSKGAVAALDTNTGATLWRSREFTDPAHYSSIVPADIEGTHQFVQLTANSLVGLAPADGTVLWKAPRKGNVAVIPTPVVDGNEIYVTSGYGVGCQMFRVTKSDGKFNAVEIYANHAMVNHHGGVIKIGDCIYGYSDSKGLTCQDFKTGEVRWAEKGKIKKGCLSYAEGALYFREEDSGDVLLVAAAPDGYHEHGRFSQPNRTADKAWAHPTIANGRLYLRDQDLLLCYDLK